MKLLILADDLTGSIDTGVQLSQIGVSTRIVTNLNINLAAAADACNVVVVDTETRHLHPQKAAEVVACLVQKARLVPFQMIYKKTDSALRGNIGAELAALAENGKGTVHFAPAHPTLNRLTINGIHYIDGQPVSQSVFGKDPFEPVRHSSVRKIIGQQSGILVHAIKECTAFPVPGSEIQILAYDATTDARLDALAEHLLQHGFSDTLLTAGCAAFASHLGRFLEKKKSGRSKEFTCEPGLLVVSGSMNPITRGQITAARSDGFAYMSLQNELLPSNSEQFPALTEKIETLCRDNACAIVEVGGESHSTLSGELKNMEEGLSLAQGSGRLIGQVIERGFRGTIAVTGGDTLRGLINAVGIRDIQPVCEIEPGVVYTIASIGGQRFGMVTKSGGLGSEHVFLNIRNFLTNNHQRGEEERCV